MGIRVRQEPVGAGVFHFRQYALKFRVLRGGIVERAGIGDVFDIGNEQLVL
jgi:hypothetical protein